MSTVELTLRLTIYILVGWLAVKTGIVSRDFSRQLSSLMMTICIPCLILRSFYNTELNADTLAEFKSMILATCVTFAVLFAVGFAARHFSRSRVEGKVALYGMLTSNFTFFGMPLVESLFGAEGLFYFTIFTTLARVVYYGCPPYMLGDGCKLSVREFLRQMLSPCIIAVIIGLVMFFARIRLTGLFDNVLAGFSSVCTPLGMMLCGMTMAEANAREALTRPAAFVMSALRLLVAPALVMAACMLCGFRPLITELAVVYSAMPFGALLPTFAKKYCADPHCALYGSTLVFISTLLSIFTVPIWIFVFEHVL